MTAQGQIFDIRKRTDPSPARRSGEGTYAFLNRVDDPAFAELRNLIEQWFAAYPDVGDENARRDLRGRLRSGSDEKFAAAFWELYLHEVHRRRGFRVTVHPETPSGARVDFRVDAGSGHFYIEAKALMTNPISGLGRTRTEDVVLDKIDEAYHPDFFVAVIRLIPGPTLPKTRSVVAQVEAWLQPLDWDAERQRPPGDERQIQTLEVEGWRLDVVALPKGCAMRNKRWVRTVATEPSRGGMSYARPKLHKALSSKATKYGPLDAPFLIALYAHSGFVDEEDLAEALYGSEVVRLTLDEDPSTSIGSAELDRKADGFWQQSGGPRHIGVAGVIAAIGFSPVGIARRWPRLWLNPWAAQPLCADRLPWPRAVASEDGDLRKVDSDLSPGDVLGLERDWPGEPFRSRRRAAA